jgi:AraC-like DNA-binding protein
MWGLFAGHFSDNVLHRHYAMQISVVSKGNFEIIDEDDDKMYFQSCVINSHVKHRFKSESSALIIFINPVSCIGHQLYNTYSHAKISGLNKELMQLSDSFSAYMSQDMSFADLVTKVGNTLMDLKCECELGAQFADNRMYKAIQYLEQEFDRVVSLKEIASYCHLSETRFLHLFKEKTNVHFRRYQLWNKLIKSLPYLITHSITETAHQFGFTDSSHYTRTFKETFGLNPKFMAHKQ